MQSFAYRRAGSVDEALAALGQGAAAVAGGTTLIDLMKLDVLTPERVVDINALDELKAFDTSGDPLVFGALARMSDVADDPVLRRDYPALSESLWLAASPQLRNLATVGGNVLQRTRCYYFRDTSYPCNRREPGTGCSALEGMNRSHAVLGGSTHCVATFPSDWATALAAFDATVEIRSPRGRRTIPFIELHRLPEDAPSEETVLEADELITRILVPATPSGRTSCYLKVRDRESYAFANASAAIVLEMDGETVRSARIGLGGLATVPWRAHAAEAALAGKPLNDETAAAAAEKALEGAVPLAHNAAKIPLGKNTVIEALMLAARRT